MNHFRLLGIDGLNLKKRQKIAYILYYLAMGLKLAFSLLLVFEALTQLTFYPSFSYAKYVVQNSRQYLNDVVLNHELPPVFVMGEVFTIEGYAKEQKVERYRKKSKNFQTSENEEYPITVFFMNKWTREKQFYFTQKLSYGERNFSIPCYLPLTGKYFIGVFVGVTGVYYPKVYQVKKMREDIDVMKELPIVPENLTFQLINNDFFIRWKRKTPITKIVFNQSENSQKFIISNDKGFFRIPYAEFKTFKKGQIDICIMHAESQNLGAYHQNSSFSKNLSKTVNITQHHFREVLRNKVQIQGQLPSVAKLNQTVKIKGKWKQPISSKAYVLEPGNYIRVMRIWMNLWKKQFQLPISIRKEGIYFVEVNHRKGFAIINTPLYVGEGYPLLPDYQDITPQIIDVQKENEHIPQKLSDQRKYILDLINKKREEFGVPVLQLDDQLNQLAQGHSDDMAKYQYVSHKDRRNLYSSQRAKIMGIIQEVKQNIASCYSVDYCQNGLDRSPAHLSNTVKPKWGRVGLGIKRDSDKVYYITQEFSTVSRKKRKEAKNDIGSMKDQIIQELSKNGKTKVEENEKVSKELRKYHDRYGFSWTLALMGQITGRFGVRGGRKMYLSINYTNNVVDYLIKRGYFYNSGYSMIGISLKLNKNSFQLLAILY